MPDAPRSRHETLKPPEGQVFLGCPVCRNLTTKPPTTAWYCQHDGVVAAFKTRKRQTKMRRVYVAIPSSDT